MIGIIAAVNEEYVALKVKMNYCEDYEIDGLDFTLGKIAGKDVVLGKSGVGKVAATICTSLMHNYFDIDYILNIGSCGALKSDIKIGEIIVADKVAFYDVLVPGWERSFDSEKVSFKMNKKLLNHALGLNEFKIHHGPIVSGDSFIHVKSDVLKIVDDFKGVVGVEMEAGAIAKTSNIFNIPCLIMRGVSDNPMSSEDNCLEFDTYLIEASKQSANFCEAFIKTYKE